MNVVEFISLSGLFSSKGDIKRLIKNNGLSLDGLKCKIDDEVKDCTSVLSMPVDQFLTEHKITRDDERVMKNCLLKFGRSNFKDNEVLSIALEDVFMFSEGKRKHFVLICDHE